MIPPKRSVEKQFQDNFEDIYLSYYPGMIRFASVYVGRKDEAENIVQDAFAEIWEARGEYFYKMNHLRAFLLAAIKNKCIDHLRHQRIVRETESKMQEIYLLDRQMKIDSLESLNPCLLFEGENIDSAIAKAIDSLPEKCRQIFIMNKWEGKKQKDIARELNLSINTVETQMGIAYKKLKEALKDYLFALLIILYM
jgi:RNA polymerase sigma-70 factor (ECF subfamily)